MNYLDENILGLSKTHPDIATQIASMHSNALVLIDTKSSARTAEYKGQLLHSKYDPLREAERIAKHTLEQFQSEGSDAIVCLGFGLAYHIEAMLKQGCTLPLIIIEPEPAIITSAFALRSFESLFELARGPSPNSPSTNLYWHLGADEKALIELFEKHNIRFPHLATLHSLIQVYEPKTIEKITNTIERFRARNELNRNTLERFGERWTRNILKNLPLIDKSHGIEDLQSLFHDMPCLICAAGPTLDEDLAILQACHERMPILAVDTALPLLEQKGIAADFLLVMEPQYWNSRHLDRGCGKLVLLSDNATYPRVFRLCEQATLVLSASFFPLGQYFDPPGRVKAGAGGSVAATAWDFARLLGAKTIYVAGLDLGFPHLKTHARGAFAEKLLLKGESRLNRMEGALMKYLYSANPIWTKAMAENKTVLSDQRMKLYRWWFEAQFKRYPDIQTHLLSQESGALEGAQLVNKDKIYALPRRREEIGKRLAIVHSNPPVLAGQYGKTIEKKCNALITSLQEIADIAEKAMKLSSTLVENPKDAAHLLPKIEALENQISLLSSKEIVGFMMQRSLRKIMESRDSSRAYENTLEFHKALLESAREQISLLSSSTLRG